MEQKYYWQGKNIKQVVIDEITDQLQNREGQEIYACDLGNELLNTDYYIIGTYEARQFVKEFIDEFNDLIEYQKSEYGEVLFESQEWERIAGQIVLTFGENALGQCDLLSDNWNDKIELTEKFIAELLNQLDDVNFEIV